MSDEPEYLAEHLRSALATDRRVYEQGLNVAVVGESIVVQGAVATPAQRDAVREVAREHLPRAEIVNDVEVVPNGEPDTVEDLG